jgi:pimeloyl-ACP methyl ester carboxylesterase
MASIIANGITIEYETFGDSSNPALLLVSGYTSQLTGFEVSFCEQLAARSLFVIRYDNRDVGKSQWFDGQSAQTDAVIAFRKGEGPRPEIPYSLSDMAADGMGLLTALGIDRAHVLGTSMGGMLAQTMAIEHGHRFLSLISVMSNTGEPEFGRSTPAAGVALMAPPPAGRDAYIAQSVQGRRTWTSKKYFDAEFEASRLARDYDRAFHPEGNVRQYSAIMMAEPRADRLRALHIETLVIHGRDDELITPLGGERTAELIPGSTLVVLNDMGHDLTRELWPVIIDQVCIHTTRAELRAGVRKAPR